MSNRTTILTAAALMLTAVLAAPAAAADGPEPECYERYMEATAGPITVVSRDSCSYEVTIDPDWQPPVSWTDGDGAATPASPELNCYQWYWEVPVGPVKIVSRDSCTYSVEENEDWEGVGQYIATGQSGPDCMPRYWEQDAGPYTIVSKNTCHYTIEENEDWDGPSPGGPGDLFQPA